MNTLREIWDLERSLWQAARAEAFRTFFYLVIATIAVGSIFYWRVEGWAPLDAVYFSVVTLATIGYGDLAPTTTAGKIFTIGYVFVGVATLGVFINAVGKTVLNRELTDTAAQLDAPPSEADVDDVVDG